MRILGLDYGSKTVGVAISDPLGITAQGLETIFRERESKLRKTCARIDALVEEYEVEKIVLGFPKNMDGSQGERCEKTLEFKEILERRTGLPVELEDERLTTVAAENVLKERYRVMANSNRPSTYFYGYLGGTDWQHITRRGGFKESLELGTISRMYKAMFNGNSVRPEFSQLNQYLIDISINAMDVSRIFGEVIRISVLRNEAAHGGEVLPKERAMKAQDVTYIHIPSPDPTIDTDSLSAAATCVNMIMEILNLF